MTEQDYITRAWCMLSLALVGDYEETDKMMALCFKEAWHRHEDHVWDNFASPEHRARRYEEQAIADSKLVEVDYESC